MRPLYQGVEESLRFTDEAGFIAFVEEDVANEAPGGAEHDPAAAAALVAFVDPFP